ncbi:MAG: FAD-dependent oxidoreductase, partial [Gemmatimonadetes bacterium]|nr:FAD-dependent oxidoreductase [Gemmatimonadota bacterium]
MTSSIPRKKIAIVGSGISGLTAAYLLQRRHDVTVFEAADYIGGHTNTVRVEVDSGQWDVDTGFIVHNPHSYPNFVRLLQQLGVASLETDMSFSVKSL